MTVQTADQIAVPIALTGMDKHEGLNRTNLTFYLFALPKFETDHSGQRVDLLVLNEES